MVKPAGLNEEELFGLRRRVADIVGRKKFTRFITALILINAATLGFATSDALEAHYGALLALIDHIIIGIFVIELGLKLFAYRGAFFRSGWNNFDFFIVGISLFPAAGPFAVVRTLRVFRLLRLISVVPRMRRVVDALLSAIPGMASVVAVLMVIFYVCAVLTTEIFSEPELEPFFGDIGNSMFTLFQIMTFENWPEVAHAVMEYHPWAWIFFITFIVITSFAVLNLFIGIIVDAMDMVKEEDIKHEEQVIHQESDLVRQEIAALRDDIKILMGKLEQKRN